MWYSIEYRCKSISIMSSVIHLVFNNLINDKDSRDDICCLCLEKAGEDSFHVRDEVTIETGHGVVVEGICTILETLLNTEILDYFNAVCKQCIDSAICSYKFVRKCKVQSEILNEAVESLLDCFNKDPEDNVEQYGSMYILVKQNFEMQKIYDVHNPKHSTKTALKCFQSIINRINIKPNTSRRKCRDKDYSTIFIKTHELVHDPSKPKEYKCKVCLKLYPNSGSLRQHFFASHFKKDFQCVYCPKSFGTKGLLRTHIAQSHLSVVCEHCGKALCNRISSLKRHAHTHARELKTCGRCGRTYVKKTDFEKHIAQESCVHPSRRPSIFRCDQCGYSCRFKNQLLQHIKYEHTDAQAHICKWCNRKCYSQSALKTHILKHTKEKNFVCSECSGRFVTRQSLINHLRLHTGERPYKCPHCDQGFLSASRRKEHIERKHVEVQFECDMCDAKYNARRSLTKHRKKHFQNGASELVSQIPV